MAFADFSSFAFEGIGKQMACQGEFFTQGGKFRKPFEDETCPGYLCWRQGSAEYQRTHAVDQIFPDGPATDHIGTHRGERFTESADQQVYLADTILFFGYSETIFTAYTDCMGFVDIEANVRIAFLQFHQATEVRNVAIHAKDTFCYDK